MNNTFKYQVVYNNKKPNIFYYFIRYYLKVPIVMTIVNQERFFYSLLDVIILRTEKVSVYFLNYAISAEIESKLFVVLAQHCTCG